MPCQNVQPAVAGGSASPAAAAPCRIATASVQFHSATPEGRRLFSVNGGVPLLAAIAELSCGLHSVNNMLKAIACSDMSEADFRASVWSGILFLETYRALAESILDGCHASCEGDVQ